MKESAKIAVSYCRSVADKYGIDKDFYEKKDLHIHAPEVIGQNLAMDIVDTWLTTEFEGGRHQRRVDKISALEG